MKKCSEPMCSAMTPGAGKCYYHQKLEAGLCGIGLKDNERRMAEYDPQIRDYVRRYPDPVVTARGRHHVLESGVLDDEQRELSSTLHALGAENETIRSALSRKKPRVLLLHQVK